MNKKYNVIVIGSGFAGLEAAGILADNRLSVLVVDENPHAGGQLLRRIPDTLGSYVSYRPDRAKRLGFEMIERVKEKDIRFMNQCTVAGIYPDKRILVEDRDKKSIVFQYDVILLATGARERFFPFPGWTLPGVYSTGLIQVLLKSSAVLPSQNILVGGSGLFLLAVGYEILKNGGNVISILEHTGMLEKVKMFSQFPYQYPKFIEGGKFMSKIFFSGVPVRYRTRIIEARGDGVLEEVVVGRVDGSGRVIAGKEKIVKTDCLVTGYGFVPNIELAQLAGCDLEYSDAGGGWVIGVNDLMETSVADVYAAGEVTGVAGSLKSATEGRIAALSILKRFEHSSYEKIAGGIRRLLRARKHHLKFGEYFNLLYRIPERSYREITDDTIICRCEDIRMGDIKKAVDGGFVTPGSLKMALRAGMGNCQARTCGPVIGDLLQILSPRNMACRDIFSSRPPAKHISFNSLMQER